jgi:hypothetical protein
MGAGEADFEKTMIIRPAAMKAMEVKPAESPVVTPPVSPPMPVSAPPSASASPSLAAKPSVSPAAVAPSITAPSSGEFTGKIQVLNGSSTGRELVLNKALTTLGKPGVQVAVITKRPNGYFITHVEGQVHPIVNGASTGAQAFALNDHDVIELAGVKMEFYLSKS